MHLAAPRRASPQQVATTDRRRPCRRRWPPWGRRADAVSLESWTGSSGTRCATFLRERLGISLFDRTRELRRRHPDRARRPRGVGGRRTHAARTARRRRLGGVQGGRSRPRRAPARGAGGAEARARWRTTSRSSCAAIRHGRRRGRPGSPWWWTSTLPGQPALTGVVPGVHGDVVHLVTFRRMQPALRLAAWVQLLAVTAAQPERAFSAITIGRAERRSSRTRDHRGDRAAGRGPGGPPAHRGDGVRPAACSCSPSA